MVDTTHFDDDNNKANIIKKKLDRRFNNKNDEEEFLADTTKSAISISLEIPRIKNWPINERSIRLIDDFPTCKTRERMTTSYPIKTTCKLSSLARRLL